MKWNEIKDSCERSKGTWLERRKLRGRDVDEESKFRAWDLVNGVPSTAHLNREEKGGERAIPELDTRDDFDFGMEKNIIKYNFFSISICI